MHSSQDASGIVVQVDKINESKARAVEAVKEGLSHAPDHPGLLGLSAQLQGRLRASSDAKMVQDPRGKLDSPAKRLALLQKSAGDAADAFSLGFCQVWGASGPVWDHPAFADAVADTTASERGARDGHTAMMQSMEFVDQLLQGLAKGSTVSGPRAARFPSHVS